MATQEENLLVSTMSDPWSEAAYAPPLSDMSRFATYAEFLRYIDPSLVVPEHRELDEYLKTEHLRDKRIKPNGWVLRIRSGQLRVHDCSEFANFSDYRHFISDHDDELQSQIIISYYIYNGYGNCPSSFYPLIPAEVDALGLELEISPIFWYSIIRESRGDDEFCEDPESRIGAERFIRVGRHYLVILPPTSGCKVDTGT